MTVDVAGVSDSVILDFDSGTNYVSFTRVLLKLNPIIKWIDTQSEAKGSVRHPCRKPLPSMD